MAIRHGADNAGSFGTTIYRASQVVAVNGTINTSDENEKDLIARIRESMLDGYALIEHVQFKWKQAINEKGDEARYHTGVIAQQVRDAFLSVGVNPFEYGLLCYDKWGDTYDDDGHLIAEAGERYAIRYDELRAVGEAFYKREAAKAKAEVRRLSEAMDAFEQRLAALEA